MRELTEELDAILERMFEAVEADRCDPLLVLDLWELITSLDGLANGALTFPDFQKGKKASH